MDASYYMNLAYQEAVKALDEGEVPIGAVVENGGRIVGRGYNRMEKLSDATAHAEILAIGAASMSQAGWRLKGCTLYVTCEPCIMCLGAVLLARIDAVVYATPDPRMGALDTFYYRQELERAYRYFPRVSSGVMAGECRSLLSAFFKRVRKN